MSLKDFLTPSYDESDNLRSSTEQNRASAANMLSAANLNNSQANRINTLLPGEMRKQGLEEVGMGLENEGKGITNDGNRIINILNQKKTAEQEKRNSLLDVELRYADQNAQADLALKEEEKRLRQAQIKQAAAITADQYSQMDMRKRQEAGYIYPRVHATMSRAAELMKAKDLQGANTLYQTMLQSLPPWFQEYEGKSGMALIGDSIDAEDSLDTVETFRDYAGMLISPDSQMGIMQKTDAEQSGMDRRQRIAADATVDAAIAKAGGNGTKQTKDQLKIQKDAGDLIATELISGIVRGKYSNGNYTDRNNRPVEPVVAAGMNMLKNLGTQVKAKNPNMDVTTFMTKDFTTANLSNTGPNLKGVVVPSNPQLQEQFVGMMESILASQNIPPAEAYKKTMAAFLQGYGKKRFGEAYNEE